MKIALQRLTLGRDPYNNAHFVAPRARPVTDISRTLSQSCWLRPFGAELLRLADGLSHPEGHALHIYRIVVGRAALGLLTAATTTQLVAKDGPRAQAEPRASSHWTWCNEQTVKAAPPVLWTRMQSATDMHPTIPSTFWSDITYRDDIAKIACYESTFQYHAQNAGQYGLFQMSSSLIVSEGVAFDEYWWGSRLEGATWYQCTAGERYIHARYGTPAVAWAHEESYGWY